MTNICKMAANSNPCFMKQVFLMNYFLYVKHHYHRVFHAIWSLSSICQQDVVKNCNCNLHIPNEQILGPLSYICTVCWIRRKRDTLQTLPANISKGLFNIALNTFYLRLFMCHQQNITGEDTSLMDLERWQQTIIFRLRTCHCRLLFHMHRLKISPSMECACGTGTQDPEHIYKNVLHTPSREHTLGQYQWTLETSYGEPNVNWSTPQFISNI